MSKKPEEVKPPKLGADAVPTITRRGDDEDEGGFASSRIGVPAHGFTTMTGAGVAAPIVVKDTARFRANRARGTRVRTALDELQAVAHLPTKDDAHAKSNANKIRAAIKKLTEELDLPEE